MPCNKSCCCLKMLAMVLFTAAVGCLVSYGADLLWQQCPMYVRAVSNEAMFRNPKDPRMLLGLVQQLIMAFIIVSFRMRRGKHMRDFSALPEAAQKRMCELREEMCKLRADNGLPSPFFGRKRSPLRLGLKLSLVSVPGLLMTYATFQIRGVICIMWAICTVLSLCAMSLVASCCGCNKGAKSACCGDAKSACCGDAKSACCGGAKSACCGGVKSCCGGPAAEAAHHE